MQGHTEDQMHIPGIEFEPFGPSSGTYMHSLSGLHPANRIVVIETVQMFAQPFSLTGARSYPMRYEQHRLPRPEVIASLEHSLKEHGDIWAELAKH
jgi:hypothetical protein